MTCYEENVFGIGNWNNDTPPYISISNIMIRIREYVYCAQ